jgi:Immunity protein 42
MQFGDIKVFAVQLELDSNYGGAWLFGRFCYWINGTQVGDYTLGTSLRDVFFSMKWIANDRGNRRGDDLCTCSGQEIFLLLDNSLYGNEETTPGFLLPEAPARFNVTPPVDVFDNWKVYLVECEKYELMIYKNLAADDKVEVFSAPKGMFDAFIMESYAYLEHLIETAPQS